MGISLNLKEPYYYLFQTIEKPGKFFFRAVIHSLLHLAWLPGTQYTAIFAASGSGPMALSTRNGR
jgi:hypothetical protein